MENNNILTESFTGFYSRRKKKRISFLTKLIGELIEKKLICVIVVNKMIVLFEPKLISALLHAKHDSVRIYAITEKKQISPGVNLLIRSKPWYRQGFIMLVGNPDLLGELVEKKSILEWDNIPLLAMQIKSDLIGYTFPLDDELRFYGKDPFKAIVLQTIKEIDK